MKEVACKVVGEYKEEDCCKQESCCKQEGCCKANIGFTNVSRGNGRGGAFADSTIRNRRQRRKKNLQADEIKYSKRSLLFEDTSSQ